MSSEIESSAVVGTSNERIARSLGYVWNSMPCNDAMRCMRACVLGTRFRAGRCIRVRLYIVAAAELERTEQALVSTHIHTQYF
jgi:hypothetical protein